MPFTAYTWGVLRDRLNERLEQKPYWDDAQQLLAVNEVLRLFNILTGFWKRRVTIATTAGTYIYTLPSTMLYRMRVEFNSMPLSPSARDDLNWGRPNWRSETTATGGDVPTTPILWAPLDLRQIIIWPADAVGANTLTVDGVSNTPVLAQDVGTVDLDDEQFDVILNCAVHILSFPKGGSLFAQTMPAWKAFLAACAEENGQIKTSSLYRRVMGLDRRDLKPLRGAPTLVDQAAESQA